MSLTTQTIKEYKKGNYQVARTWLIPLLRPEPFVAVFNTGTIDANSKNSIGLEHELTRRWLLAQSH